MVVFREMDMAVTPIRIQAHGAEDRAIALPFPLVIPRAQPRIVDEELWPQVSAPKSARLPPCAITMLSRGTHLDHQSTIAATALPCWWVRRTLRTGFMRKIGPACGG